MAFVPAFASILLAISVLCVVYLVVLRPISATKDFIIPVTPILRVLSAYVLISPLFILFYNLTRVTAYEVPLEEVKLLEPVVGILLLTIILLFYEAEEMMLRTRYRNLKRTINYFLGSLYYAHFITGSYQVTLITENLRFVAHPDYVMIGLSVIVVIMLYNLTRILIQYLTEALGKQKYLLVTVYFALVAFISMSLIFYLVQNLSSPDAGSLFLSLLTTTVCLQFFSLYILKNPHIVFRVHQKINKILIITQGGVVLFGYDFDQMIPIKESGHLRSIILLATAQNRPEGDFEESTHQIKFPDTELVFRNSLEGYIACMECAYFSPLLADLLDNFLREFNKIFLKIGQNNNRLISNELVETSAFQSATEDALKIFRFKLTRKE